MQWRRIAVRLGIAAALATPGGCVAQVGSPVTVQEVLHRLSDRAAVVFVGSVTRIERVEGDGRSSGVVEVTFQVEQAVRGAGAGSTYTLREWSGLWMATDRRYAVGERLLMLLNAPGAGGLSSPVAGMDGAIPVHGSGVAVLGGSGAPGAAVVDLRWLQARVRRQVLYAPASLQGAHGSPFQGVTARVGGGAASASATAAEETNTATASVARQMGVASVLRLLAVWSNGDAR